MTHLVLHINEHEYKRISFSFIEYKNEEFSTRYKLRKILINSKVERLKTIYKKEIKRAKTYEIILEVDSKMNKVKRAG